MVSTRTRREFLTGNAMLDMDDTVTLKLDLQLGKFDGLGRRNHNIFCRFVLSRYHVVDLTFVPSACLVVCHYASLV